MRSKILLIAMMFIVGLGGYSQHKLSGVIIDEESGETVSDAFIMKENGLGVISDSQGQFVLVLEVLPSKIVISHIAYGKSDITIDEMPKGMLVIRIQKMISNMEEVQISAERMRILTEKDDFSLQDFAIDSTNMWMLGYINNRPKNGRLWMANLFGDTLLSIPVNRPEKLYRDVFGNVHLFFEDSVFQLFGTPDTIGFVDGLSRKEFQRIFNPIKGYFAGKLIYQDYLPMQEGLHTYYYSLSDSLPKFIACIRDTTGEILQEDEYVYGYAASSMTAIIECENITDRLRLWQEMMQRKATKKYQFYRRLEVPVFHTKDNLYILNLYKDSLLVYSTSRTYIDSKSISFHEDLNLLKGTSYRDLQYLFDQSTERVFCLERKKTGWLLSYLDTDEGKILENVPLPDFPGMTGITVNNNAVYFLYPEKKYPYYSRLYRYQL